MLRTLAVVVLTGCFYGGGYHTMLSPFPGKRVSLPCLDLSVAMTDDSRAPSPVIQYSFGNRCTHTTTVDLASIHAVGFYDDNRTAELTARDPDHELAALPIDGWWHGTEEISYQASDGSEPKVVCVDVGRVDSASDGTPQWVCVGGAVQ
jgi:hypothetical protein